MRGRADALLGSLLLEFEPVLDEEHEEELLRRYVAAVWSPTNRHYHKTTPPKDRITQPTHQTSEWNTESNTTQLQTSSTSKAKSKKLSENIIIDLGPQGEIIGVYIPNFRKTKIKSP
ncbi:MAG: hypothetical protein N3H84_01705 [Candidatus Caldarchaeum sp.]|nr:hypothetical protein [Candidatus Caldarchaeum sp.]